MSEAHGRAIEDLIVEVRKAGYRVNNLWHRRDGMWASNLRSQDGVFFAFGYGVGAELALEKALAHAIARKPGPATDHKDDERPHDQVPFDSSPTGPEAPDDDDEDILG